MTVVIPFTHTAALEETKTKSDYRGVLQHIGSSFHSDVNWEIFICTGCGCGGQTTLVELPTTRWQLDIKRTRYNGRFLPILASTM